MEPSIIKEIIEAAVSYVGVSKIAEDVAPAIVSEIKKGIAESVKNIDFGDILYDILQDGKFQSEITKRLLSGFKEKP